MSLSGLTKFLFGVILAIGILFGAGVVLTRYLLDRLATPPPKPVFANDPSPPLASPVVSTAPDSTPSPEVPPDAIPASPSPDTPSPAPEGYQARVIQPIGLILRDQPSTDSAQLGGVEYNQEVIVLEDSADGGWQRVRLSNGAEGWVKGGNTERLN